MATVEQAIAVKIRAFVEGLAQVQALSASVRSLNRPVGDGLSRTRKDVTDLGKASLTSANNVATLVNAMPRVAKGFADGTRNAKSFTAELGNVARELKPITDASRLLGAAKSIQLPRGFQGRVTGTETLTPLAVSATAKPLVEVEQTVNRTAASAKTLRENTSGASLAARDLAKEWHKANEAQRAAIESFAKNSLGKNVNTQFQALIAGSKSTGGGTSKAVKEVVKDVDAAIPKTRTLTQQFNTATSAVFRMRAAVLLVGTAITAIATAAGIYALLAGIREVVQAGVQFNSTLENAKIGLAGIISNTFEIRDANGNLVTGIDAYNAGLALAGTQMSKLRAATIETSFEFEDLLESLTNASSAVAGTNTSLEKTVDLVVKLSRVGSAINLTPSELSTQTGQVLRGSTRVQTRLAQALFPGEDATQINKQIKAFREAGTLAEELEKRMAKFQFTANDIANTFTALANNAGDAFKLFAGEATLKLFNGIKEALRFIISQVVVINDEGVKLTPTFQKIANIFNVISGQLGARLLGTVKAIFEAISRWVSTFTASEAELRGVADAAYEVGRQLVGIVADALQFLNVTVLLGTNVATLRDLFNALALAIAFGRDLMNIFKNIITVTVNGPAIALVGAFELIARMIDAATLGLTNFAGKLTSIRQMLQDGWLSAVFGLGNPSANSQAAIANMNANNALRGSAGGSFEPGFSASPIKGSGGDADGGAKSAKRKAEELRRALNQMFDAIEALQIAGAEREIAIEREKDQLLLDIAQDRFDRGVVAAREYYKEKQKIDLADVQREEQLLERKKRIAQNSLNRQIGANLGREATAEDIANVKLAFRQVAGGGQAPKDKVLAQNIKEYAETAKEVVKIDEQLAVLEEKRKGLIQATTREIEKQARINKRNALDIEGELADSFGQGGVSAGNNLAKRISDEFSKALSEFGHGNFALEVIAEEIQKAGAVSFKELIHDFDVLGIEISGLPKPLQDFIKLLERTDNVNAFTKLASEAEKIQQTLGFGVDGAFKGFDLGTPFETALGTIDALTSEALPLLEQKYKELVELTTGVSGDGAVLFTPEEIEFVNQLGLKVDELRNKVKALQLTRSNSQNAADIADRAVESVQIRQTAGTLNQIEAEKELIDTKRGLIKVYQDELNALLAINEAARSREQSLQILDLQNKIGELNNQINANAISIREGILNSIGGAFENFFDSVLSGNESILTSFRRVISQMLIEIGKLIFQTLVWKQIMSVVQSFVGGLAGSFGGGSSSGAGNPGGVAGFDGVGFAEGGYTGEGPRMEAAGIVHRGEHVMPAHVVKKPGMLAYLESLRNGSFLPSFRGFAVGGGVATNGTPAGKGSGQSQNIRNIIVFDNTPFEDYLNSSEGERIIVNYMSKNAGMIQRLA